MTRIQTLRARLRAFWQDQTGSITVEFVLVMPILFWTFMAGYVYFDGYRQSSINLKAAYTISDLLSRETQAITPEYIDSMYELHRLLVRATSPTTLRVSVVRWDEDENRYYRDWSAARGGIEALSNSDLVDLADKLPVMPDAERVILVETTNTFVPLFNVGMENKSLDNFVFTRPRFAPQLAWSSPSS